MVSRFLSRPNARQARWIARVAGVAAIGSWVAPLASIAVADRAHAHEVERHADCRLIDADSRRDLRIVREDPSVDSDSVGQVYPGERVQLAEDWRSISDPFGYYWVEIVEPMEGYIANRHIDDGSSTLRHCDYRHQFGRSDRDGFRVPEPTTTRAQNWFIPEPPEERSFSDFYNYCQEVVQPEGLSIRERPSENSTRLGGVDDGRRVLIAEDAEPVLDRDGRYWLPIDAPIAGYISGGFSENFENVEPCRDYDFRR